MPANRGGLYTILPPWWAVYACPYLLFAPTPLIFLYYGGLFLHDSFDDIRRVITVTIYEFAILAGVQFLLYAAEWVALDYFVGSLGFDHVGAGMLFWLRPL